MIDRARRRLRSASTLEIQGAIPEALHLAVDAFVLAGKRDAELEAKIAARGTIVDARAGDRELLAEIRYVLENAPHTRRRDLALQGAAIAALAIYLLSRLLHPLGVHAVASAEFDMAHPASHVTDGREATEWLLPDNATGFIELRFRRRAVRALRILNGTNRPGPDRAVVTYEVEVYDGDTLVKKIPGTLGTFQPRPTWQRVALDVSKATRVRLVVKTWAGSGGGIAELALE